MRPAEVETAEDAFALVNERGLSHVKLGFVDMDGVMRGKYMGRDKFQQALESGFGFCDVIVGWDTDDQLYDNVDYTGWQTGYPDAPVRVIPESCRNLPLEDGGLFFLCELAAPADAICPRGLLRRVLDRMANMGLRARAGFEYEFGVFAENPHSIRQKDYRDLKPIAPGFFGYSILRNSVHSKFYRALLELSEGMDFGLEGLHEESGPGALEAAIRVDEALAAADKAAVFKTFTKVQAEQQDLMATFMARWSTDYPGQSGHIHISLTDLAETPIFHDEAADGSISESLRHFIGGQQRLMPEFLAMIAPTINSYRRLVPGFWAPTWASWGIDNRTTALRLVPGNAASQRVEFRIAAADANPYICLSAAMASGLWGIENRCEPETAVEGSAYDVEGPEELRLPKSLMDAAAALRGSQAARDWFGDEFVDHFSASREWEEREFRKSVTDWELRRYFEII